MEQELPKPLVSDQLINDEEMAYASAVEGNDEEAFNPDNEAAAWAAGARWCRDLYEPELQRLRSQVEAMRVAGSAMLEILKYGNAMGSTIVLDAEVEDVVNACDSWTASLNPTPTTER